MGEKKVVKSEFSDVQADNSKSFKKRKNGEKAEVKEDFVGDSEKRKARKVEVENEPTSKAEVSLPSKGEKKRNKENSGNFNNNLDNEILTSPTKRIDARKVDVFEENFICFRCNSSKPSDHKYEWKTSEGVKHICNACNASLNKKKQPKLKNYSLDNENNEYDIKKVVLKEVETYMCFRCEKERSSLNQYHWSTVDGVKIICNGCNGNLLAMRPKVKPEPVEIVQAGAESPAKAPQDDKKKLKNRHKHNSKLKRALGKPVSSNN